MRGYDNGRTHTSSARKLSDVLEGDVVAIDYVQRFTTAFAVVVVDDNEFELNL